MSIALWRIETAFANDSQLDHSSSRRICYKGEMFSPAGQNLIMPIPLDCQSSLSAMQFVIVFDIGREEQKPT